MRIDPTIGSVAPISEALAPALSPASAAPTTSFADIVSGAIHEASSLDKAAEARATALAKGAVDDLHGTMIAAKEAEISLHLIGTVRNRLLDAFHELWRTGI